MAQQQQELTAEQQQAVAAAQAQQSGLEAAIAAVLSAWITAEAASLPPKTISQAVGVATSPVWFLSWMAQHSSDDSLRSRLEPIIVPRVAQQVADLRYRSGGSGSVTASDVEIAQRTIGPGLRGVTDSMQRELRKQIIEEKLGGEQDIYDRKDDGSGPAGRDGWVTRLSRQVAQTTTETARMEAAKVLDFRKKVWISRDDDRVRSLHNALHLKKIPINDAFKTKAGPIRFPGDRAATIENWINCRCVILFL